MDSGCWMLQLDSSFAHISGLRPCTERTNAGGRCEGSDMGVAVAAGCSGKKKSGRSSRLTGKLSMTLPGKCAALES